MLRAVIFDMDGLLIDSEPLWRKSHMAALAEHNVSITEDDVRKMAGKRTDEIVRHWREKHKLAHIPNDTLEANVVSKVIENIHMNGVELPGVHELISLFDAHRIPMAVASSVAPEIIEAALTKLRLSQYMQVTYSAKHEAFGKPHPGVFLTTARKLGVDPAECLVFEDSLNGVRAAKAAGMKCVAVPETANLLKPEFAHEADLVVPNLKGLDWPTIAALF